MDAAENVRHGVAAGEPPHSPPTYDKTYRAPAHRVKALERMHPHERDESIEFLEKPHIYVIEGKPYEISVTGVVSAYSEPFDADTAISKMMQSRNEAWPRKAYAVGVSQLTLPIDAEVVQHIMLVSRRTLKTLYAGPPPNTKDNQHKDEAQWALGKAASKKEWLTIADIDFFSYTRSMTPDEIKSDWDRNATEKSNMGTEAHLGMELWLNSEPTRDTPEMHAGLAFVREKLATLGVKAYRTEWEIFADSEKVAGSIDCVCTFPDGTLLVCDWKRTKKHDIINPYGRRMSEPLSHLHDTDVCKFALQLSTYAFILEKYYGFRVSGLCMVSIHPEHAFHTFVPYLEKEVAFLMRERRERVAAQERISLEHAEGRLDGIPLCSLCGEIAWHPVRDKQGNICDEKVALAQNFTDLTQDKENQDKIDCLINSVDLNVPSAEKSTLKCAPQWSTRMPEKGYPDFVDCRSVA